MEPRNLSDYAVTSIAEATKIVLEGLTPWEVDRIATGKDHTGIPVDNSVRIAAIKLAWLGNGSTLLSGGKADTVAKQIMDAVVTQVRASYKLPDGSSLPDSAQLEREADERVRQSDVAIALLKDQEQQP